jgi:hypothetical protein
MIKIVVSISGPLDVEKKAVITNLAIKGFFTGNPA